MTSDLSLSICVQKLLLTHKYVYTALSDLVTKKKEKRTII